MTVHVDDGNMPRQLEVVHEGERRQVPTGKLGLIDTIKTMLNIGTVSRNVETFTSKTVKLLMDKESGKMTIQTLGDDGTVEESVEHPLDTIQDVKVGDREDESGRNFFTYVELKSGEEVQVSGTLSSGPNESAAIAGHIRSFLG